MHVQRALREVRETSGWYWSIGFAVRTSPHDGPSPAASSARRRFHGSDCLCKCKFHFRAPFSVETIPLSPNLSPRRTLMLSALPFVRSTIRPMSTVLSETHYSVQGLFETICSALKGSGKLKDGSALQPADLAAVDQFHTRGKFSTQNLAEQTGISSLDWVLDVGSGLGGPARYLASSFGARVLGIDLVQEYVRTAVGLSELSSLSHLVAFVQADACRLPFPDRTFSVVWTQHVTMNIQDKARLYSELARVLVPGGRLAFSDALQGPGWNSTPLRYPVPWASSSDASFVIAEEELRAHLVAQQLWEVSWEDKTEEALQMLGRARTGDAPAAAGKSEAGRTLGLHLVLGPRVKDMVANLRDNLEHERLKIVDAVFEKAMPSKM